MQETPETSAIPGVCSVCLRERLKKISRSSSRGYHIRFFFFMFFIFFSLPYLRFLLLVSNTASPMHDNRKGQISFLKSKLKKSKSMAFVSERTIDMMPRRKVDFGSKLMHSRTMKEC
ncbi:unnamed protein product [Lactuca virosa]|uniref:Transmembrane protein n=1 Tax=Lactuca virosa TaxID=75947 RepID=A0AAU9PUS5_9ASTR|nr:unnamed protein product [Lactuca virosa]